MKIDMTSDELFLLIELVENKIDDDEEYIEEYGDELLPNGRRISDELKIYKDIFNKLCNVISE